MENIRGSVLTPGAARRGLFGWKAAPNGEQLIVMIDEEERTLMPLPLSPPWYVDLETGECGPFDAGLPDSRAQILAGAPVLPPGATEAVARKLGETQGRRPPAPKLIPREERRDIAPVPVLRLFGARAQERRRIWRPGGQAITPQTIPALRLAFDYDGARANGRDKGPLEIASCERLRVIHRNRRTEAAFADEFAAWAESFGFLTVTEINPAYALRGIEDDDYALEPADLDITPQADPIAAPLMDDALAFMDEVLPRLRERGWRVETDESWSIRLHDGPVDLRAGIEGSGIDWFTLTLEIEAGDQRIEILPIILQLIADLPPEMPEGGEFDDILEGVCLYPALPDGTRVRIAGETLAPILHAFLELHGLGGEMHLARAGEATALAEALEGADDTISRRFGRSGFLSHLVLSWAKLPCDTGAAARRLKHAEVAAGDGSISSWPFKGLQWSMITPVFSFDLNGYLGVEARMTRRGRG